MNDTEREKFEKWIDKVSVSYLRSLLSVTQLQAQAIKNGDYSGHEKLLLWAATTNESLGIGTIQVADELEKIKDLAGIPSRQLAIALALPPRIVVDALKGEPVKYLYGVYIKELARNTRLLERVLERK